MKREREREYVKNRKKASPAAIGKRMRKAAVKIPVTVALGQNIIVRESTSPKISSNDGKIDDPIVLSRTQAYSCISYHQKQILTEKIRKYGRI